MFMDSYVDDVVSGCVYSYFPRVSIITVHVFAAESRLNLW